MKTDPLPPTPSAHTLGYAPPRRRFRVRRWIVLLLIVQAAGLLWYYRPALRTQWGYAQSWYWQRQCQRFALPPDTVVFQQCLTADEAAAMVATGRYVALPTWPNAGYRPNSVALKHPDGYVHTSGLGAYSGYAVVFLHERTTADGQKRLAIVPTCTAINPRDKNDPLYPPNIELDPYTQSIAGWGQGNPAGGRGPLAFLHFPKSLTRDSHRLKLFAGQADPADASHFTIAYECDGERGVIDGYLQDDLRLRLSFRDGPATRASR